MRKRAGRRARVAGAVVAGLALIVGMTGVAGADEIDNDVDNNVDAAVENVVIGVGGTTTVAFRVEANAGNANNATIDGDAACNLDGGAEALTVSVNSSNAAVATASPASLTFTGCSNSFTGQPFTVVSGLSGGTATFTLSITSNNTGAGAYVLGTATFSVTVDGTPPVITPTVAPASPDGANGWYTSNVTLTWSVTDPETPPNQVLKTGCVNQSITADQTATTYSCSATSLGGSAGPVNVTIKRDATDPVVTVTGPTNGGTYNAGSVPVAGCDTQDATSGVFTNATVALTGVGSVTATCSGGTDNAGNTADPVSVTYTVITLDSTPPVITPSVTGTLGNNGWYTSDVNVSWSVVDDESTISDQTGCDPSDVTSDTAGVTFTCSATSKGGTNSQSVTIKRDATAPTSTASLAPVSPDGDNGWYVTAPTASFSCSDATSGVASCEGDHLFGEGANQSFTGTVTDNAGNTNTASAGPVDVDLTAPTITASLAPVSPDGNSNWYVTAPTATFTCSDATSDIATCEGPHGFGEGAGQSFTGTATDNAGNTNTAAAGPVSVDLTDPGITWNGSIDDGDSFFFGSVPLAPTCTASDGLSGPDGCSVTGYGTTVGSHTLIATAHDVAGNEATDQRGYTVKPWNLTGLYQPVDMGASAWNSVKSGSTVPLKFEVFGDTEITSTSVIVATIKYVQVACPGYSAGTSEEPIETTSTGGTSLRYDATAGQFIYNWKTPAKPGKCFQLTLTTADGSTLTANFKLK